MYDVSLPLEQYYGVVEHLRALLGGDAMECTGYGHVGDGKWLIVYVCVCV